jgi:hypothetical protein
MALVNFFFTQKHLKKILYQERKMCSAGNKMDDLKTGTATYMSLYPEKSTDGTLRLGNIVPDFSCDTTQGHWDSFHKWKEGKV